MEYENQSACNAVVASRARRKQKGESMKSQKKGGLGQCGELGGIHRLKLPMVRLRAYIMTRYHNITNV